MSMAIRSKRMRSTVWTALALAAGCGLGAGGGSGLVADDRPPEIAMTSLPPGDPARAYAAPIVTSGGKLPLRLSIAAGALPAGLSLAAGAIWGTPIESGTTRFTLRVTDAKGRVATRELSIRVATETPDAATAYDPQARSPNGTGRRGPP